MASESSYRQEVAAFLRSRRERIRPEDVGIPASSRRRTVGLRREEVAQLAGIGVTWYTWLEQGRDVRPSVAVAMALSKALKLSEFEQAHLIALTHREDSTPVSMPGAPLETLCANMTSPAYVRDSTGDMLAWNDAAAEFFDDFGPAWEGRSNLLIYMFLNERSRHTFKDWPDVTARTVAQFRRVNGGCEPGTRAGAVVSHLAANSAEFRTMWDTFEVMYPYIGQRTLRDKDGKDCVFSYATLASPHAPSPWITMYIPIVPAPAATAE